jgi:glucose/arabinose dehydrogenase
MKVFRIFTSFIVGSLFILGGCNIRKNIPPKVGLELVGEGFTSPVALVTPPDGSDRFFIVDQIGIIWIVSDRNRIEKPFLDLRSSIVELNSFYDERGLLGLAFHPEFARNGIFYVSYSGQLRSDLSVSEWDHTTYVSEFTISVDDPNRADPASERIVLAMDKPGYNYEAGHIAFGPDGYLYIATGDSVRNPAEEAGQYAQDTFSLLGKILRIDINKPGEKGEEYAIPPDNPFVEGGGRPEVYAFGLRNPYRFSFDVWNEETRLFVIDVGQAVMEEVSLVVKGGNYGWPIREGTKCFNSKDWNQPVEHCPTGSLIDPIIAYTHQNDLSAIIGGAIYRGEMFSSLQEDYVFGDWGRGNGHLFVAYPPTLRSGLWDIKEIEVELPGNQSGIGQLLGIGQDEHSELYLLTKDQGVGPIGRSGRLYKLIPP